MAATITGSKNLWITRIETKIGVRVDIDKGYHLVKGQGHWVKGQGQIHNFLKN